MVLVRSGDDHERVFVEGKGLSIQADRGTSVVELVSTKAVGDFGIPIRPQGAGVLLTPPEARSPARPRACTTSGRTPPSYPTLRTPCASSDTRRTWCSRSSPPTRGRSRHSGTCRLPSSCPPGSGMLALGTLPTTPAVPTVSVRVLVPHLELGFQTSYVQPVMLGSNSTPHVSLGTPTAFHVLAPAP